MKIKLMSEKSTQALNNTKQLSRLLGQWDILSRLCNAFAEYDLDSKLESIQQEMNECSDFGRQPTQGELAYFEQQLNAVYTDFIERH